MKTIFGAILGISLIASVSAGAQTKKAHSSIKAIKPVIIAPKTTAPATNKKVMNEEEFLVRFPEVKTITWAPGAVATLEKADGSKEQYSLDNYMEEKRFIAVYGKILRRAMPAHSNN